MNEVENKQLVTSFPSHLNMIQSRNTSFPINQRTPLAARHNCESFSRKDVLISTPKSHPRSLTEDGNLRLKKNGNISSSSLTPGSRKVTYKSAGELEYGTDGQLTADKRSSVGSRPTHSRHVSVGHKVHTFSVRDDVVILICLLLLGVVQFACLTLSIPSS